MTSSYRLLFALIITTLALFDTVAWADERVSEDIDIESLTDLTVELIDQDGNPISDAAVMVYAMRMEEGGGHGFWNSKKLGPPKPIASDATGTAIVQYPAKVFGNPNPLTTKTVTFSVGHHDYVHQVVNFELGPEAARVTLKRGCDIQLSAVDHKNEPLSDFAVLIAGNSAPSFWTDDDAGGRRTGSASVGNWQTMIVKPQANGVTLFSTVLPLRVRPEQAVRIRNVRVKPGTKIVGKLSDNVPRPVKNGYVITTTAPKPTANSFGNDNPSLLWHECAEVDPKGNFVMKSVPRSGKIQIIAICDDWLSKTIPDEKFFVKGQLFDIDDNEMELTVEMEETGTLELSITRPDGTPLETGKVSSWPNQQFYKGGSTLLGIRFNTMDQVKNQMLPADQQKQMDRWKDAKLPFVDQPVTNGKVTLRGLPIKRNNSSMLEHPDYTLPGGNTLRFNIDSAEINKRDVEAQRIKTKS